jgi:hypothetical protein
MGLAGIGRLRRSKQGSSRRATRARAERSEKSQARRAAAATSEIAEAYRIIQARKLIEESGLFTPYPGGYRLIQPKKQRKQSPGE